MKLSLFRNFTLKLAFRVKYFSVLIGMMLLSLNVVGQVTVLKEWTTEYNGTGNLSKNYTVPTGNNRFLVVAIASARDDNGTRQISSITYGGQTLSLAAGNMENSYRAHTSIYYLNQAGLAAAGSNKTLAVSFRNDGTPRSNSVFAAVFENVNQLNPIVDTKQYSNSSESSSASFTDFKVNLNNQAVKVLCSYRYSAWLGHRNRNISNFGTNWGNPKQTTTETGGLTFHNTLNAVGTRETTSSYITESATVTMDGDSYLSMSGISIRAVPKYFRSRSNGNWNSTSTWQSSLDGMNWVNASSYPTYDDYKTTIQAGDTVTLNREAGVSDIDIHGTLNTSTQRFLGANSLDLKSSGKIIIGGNNTIEGFSTINVEDGSTVEYNGSGNQDIYGGISYSNLVTSGSGTKTFTSDTQIRHDLTANAAIGSNANVQVSFIGNEHQEIKGNSNNIQFDKLRVNKTSGNLILKTNVSVSNQLQLTKGHIDTSDGNLQITNTSTEAIIGDNNDFSNSHIIGALSRNITNQTNNHYIYPISKNGKYYPFYLNNPIVGTGTISATVEAFNSDTGGSLDGTMHSKSDTEYWKLSTTGFFSNAGVSIARPEDIAPFDIVVGSISQTGIYTNLYGDAATKAVNYSDNIGANRFFTFGKAAPTIDAQPFSLSGFSYSENYGPSNVQTITVSGSHLIANVRLQSTEHFEISRFDGNQFTPVNTLTLNITGSTLNETEVYIRLKNGLAQGTYNNILYIESQDAVTKEVSLIGQVTDPPLITLNPTTVSGFTYTFGGGPSSYQTFTVSGSNLKENVVLTAPSKFEISKSSGSGYGSSLSYSHSNGTLSNQTVYVRMKSGLGAETHIQELEANSLHAARKTVNLIGSVLPGATIFNSKSILKNMIYTVGSGPSGTESFELSAVDLTANITIQAPTYFQLSTNGTTWSSSLTIPRPSSGSILSAQTIYVRLQAGLSVGEYGIGEVITISSTGAQGKAISVYGRVVNAATVLVSRTALNGFGYAAADGGPSPYQSFVVSGANLSGNITITPPADGSFEIKSPSGDYTTQAITLTPTNGKVDPTIIQIRLKAGLTAGDYNKTLSVSASGVSNQNISLLGKVYASPVISATDDGGGVYCTGDDIQLRSEATDLIAQYWNGPNEFYSTEKDPVITNATPAMSGKYTVTGNVIIGGNLVFNGDFELGNVGVNSGYTYKAITSYTQNKDAPLWSESTYAITDIPSKAHPHFPNASNPLYQAGNNKMIVNGANIAGVVVWSQSVMVVSNADFEFSYEIASMVPTDPAQLQLYVNGVPAGPIYEPSDNIEESITYSYITHVPEGVEVVNLEIINYREAIGGNDFALDNLTFHQILIATDTVDIVVHQPVDIGVSITATPSNNVEEGTPVTFTAHLINPGENPTFEWYINNIKIEGENGVTFSTAELQNNDKVKCIMRSSLPCTNQDFIESNSIEITVFKLENYWVGSTGTNGTNWGVATNWSAGRVPDMGVNIEFATADNNEGVAAINNLELDADRTIGSLINKTNKLLIIPTGKSLTVNGNITTDNENRILIKAAANQLNGSLIFPNVTNPVYATVEMWTKGYFNESNQNDGNNKYIWQFFGPPLHNYVLDPHGDFYGSAVRQFNESAQTDKEGEQWKQLYNYDVIEKFKGYEITQAQPKKVVFKGKLVKDNMKTEELAVTAGSFYKGWHLLSNPYTAAIGVRDLEFGPGMDEVVYIYNTGAFTDWQTSSKKRAVWSDQETLAPGQYLAIPKNLAGFSTSTGIIPSMQAFLVGVTNRNTTPPSSGKTVSYNYANLVKNTQMQRVKEKEPKFVYSMVTVTGKETYDKLWLFTDEACSPKYDNGWDGKKMDFNKGAVQLVATQGDREVYQIHATDDINDTYLLLYPELDNASYTLHFKHQNMHEVYNQIQLYDNVTKKLIDITADGSQYTFTAKKKDNPTRFKIITETIEYQTRNTFIYPMHVDNQRIIIDNITNDSGIARVYNTSGQLVSTKHFEAATTTEFIVNHSGVYIVQVETEKRLASQKVIVN